MSTFNWGIVGTGNIACSMAAALPHVPGARRLAVGSRAMEPARAFAGDWGFERAYNSYDALMQDADIDIIYIATPNAMHKDTILAALAAGKHVLCEKPMTLSAEDSATCFDVAEENGLVLMEALWSAFIPAMQRARELVRSGAIGTPRHLIANFVSLRDPAQHPILFDPALGGGARNDLGIYPLAAALLLARQEQRSRQRVDA
ncbi:MAG: Gfo/Idh/MocA family oxidoreductase, partial [Pseudomonadota bacterium]